MNLLQMTWYTQCYRLDWLVLVLITNAIRQGQFETSVRISETVDAALGFIIGVFPLPTSHDVVVVVVKCACV